MSTNRPWSPARFATRLLGRSVSLGLLTLALVIAIISFLTACRCDEPYLGLVPRRDTVIPTGPIDTKTVTSPNDLPVVPPANKTKDN
jgi:hypothetical protein